jgi:8-oxo-dGTP pyrophosphatase MutT (NUDIX family)
LKLGPTLQWICVPKPSAFPTHFLTMSFPFATLPAIPAVDAIEFATKRHAATKSWMAKVAAAFKSPKYTVSDTVTVHAAVPFGPITTAKAGFVLASTSIGYTKTDGSAGVVPGVAFLRGSAVAILVILRCGGTEHVVLTIQPRVPIADPAYIETPAGMMDGDSNFAGKAALELKQETGLVITDREMRRLGKIVPSAGGCDETIELFLYKADVSAEKLAELQGKATGELSENEDIVLAVRSLRDVRAAILDGAITDAKLVSALYYYDCRGDTSATTA